MAQGEMHDEVVEYSHTRDPQCRARIVEHYDWVAVHAARRFRDRGEPGDDLLQVARIGVLKALERFDPAAGATFPAYAMATALGELRRHFRDATWRVHVPRAAKDMQTRLRPVIEQATQELGRSPTAEELAERLGVSHDAILAALDAAAANRTSSLDARAPVTGTVISDMVAAPDVPLDDAVTVRDLLSRLPERERRIVSMRFFDGLSQEEIARAVGVSQVHVSRLLRSSLAAMRAALEPTD